MYDLPFKSFKLNIFHKRLHFTTVNTKTVVLTIVNTHRFSKILPLIMVYLQIVQFSVCFTIVIFEKSLFSLEMVLWTSKYHFWEVNFWWLETYFNSWKPLKIKNELHINIFRFQELKYVSGHKKSTSQKWYLEVHRTVFKGNRDF